MAQNKIAKIIVFGFLLVYTLSFVSSANIGISPANVIFKDVTRGGYGERYVVISVDSDEPILVSLSVRGDVSGWFNYSEESFKVSKSNPYYLKVSVNPPLDIPNGNYTGFMRVMTESFSDGTENNAVGKIRSSLDLSIFVSVTDIELRDCFVDNVEIISPEKDEDVVLKMDILNKGNVRLNPKVLFNIWDSEQLNILFNEEFLSKTILPTRKESVEFRFNSNDLEVGQYWSNLIVTDCLQDFLLTFDVLEKGALKSNGVLLNILSKKEAKVKETVPFEASFKNIGEKEVSAQFKGKAIYNGEVVQVFESEKLKVSKDEIEKFGFYFTPQKEGKYIISGRIYYDNKKTYEVSSALDVYSNGKYAPFIYGVFVFLILFLFYKIRKEKKIYRKRLRELR